MTAKTTKVICPACGKENEFAHQEGHTDGPREYHARCWKEAETAVYAIGYGHGQAVPADPASSEMAWSDLRAAVEQIPTELETEYVRGHMDGQAAAGE